MSAIELSLHIPETQTLTSPGNGSQSDHEMAPFPDRFASLEQLSQALDDSLHALPSPTLNSPSRRARELGYDPDEIDFTNSQPFNRESNPTLAELHSHRSSETSTNITNRQALQNAWGSFVASSIFPPESNPSTAFDSSTQTTINPDSQAVFFIPSDINRTPELLEQTFSNISNHQENHLPASQEPQRKITYRCKKDQRIDRIDPETAEVTQVSAHVFNFTLEETDQSKQKPSQTSPESTASTDSTLIAHCVRAIKQAVLRTPDSKIDFTQEISPQEAHTFKANYSPVFISPDAIILHSHNHKTKQLYHVLKRAPQDNDQVWKTKSFATRDPQAFDQFLLHTN